MKDDPLADPTPIRADLPRAVGGGVATPPPRAPSPATQDAVDTAIETFLAANLGPIYGFDAESAKPLWAAQFRSYQPDAIVKAAVEWVGEPGAGFPTMAEFETLVSYHDRALNQLVAPPRPAGQACPECGNSQDNATDGWVTFTNPLEGGINTVRPCQQCNPARWEAWRRHWKKRPKTNTR